MDVEGEDNSVITDEEPEEETATASSDADTTTLFTKPIYNGLSTLGTLRTPVPSYYILFVRRM